MKEVAIIGGGILGLAIGYELGKQYPKFKISLFEKGGTSGVRAQAIRASGELEMDFNIIKENNQIHVLNAPSPGATASLSIAKHSIQNYIQNLLMK